MKFTVACWVLLFAAIAVGRIFLSYKNTSQGFDEPCHVAAGIELVDKGKYTLDVVHPPLSRWTIGLSLYLTGERYPQTGPGSTSGDYNVVGNSILYDSGHHMRDLTLARLGVLPFYLFAVLIVFLWTRREFGDFAAVMAVAIFTTTPIVLALSGIAYSDMAAASTQAAALLSFAIWLEKKTTRSSATLGIALGLALSAKFTSLIFFPAAAAAVWIAKLILGTKTNSSRGPTLAHQARQMILAAGIACCILWGSYRFAFGHIREDMGLSLSSIPTFQNFPAPLARAAHALVLSDPVIPAPAMIKGLATVWVLNHASPSSYLLGHIRHGGWWYFFLVGIAVKSPLPFLILALVGLFASWQLARKCQWTALAPAASALAILLVTMPVKYNAGIRHVMVIFPLLAIIAGHGCSWLWQSRKKGTAFCRVALLGLLAWQAAASWRARSDYLAYFNEFAGHDPSRVLVMGCDLDCGQDVDRLAQELRLRNISRVTLALWTSADISREGFPEFSVAQPFQPAAGWFAISLRALRFGDLFHQTYPAEAFAWLRQYQPVARVGETILLYYIPQKPDPSSAAPGTALTMP